MDARFTHKDIYERVAIALGYDAKDVEAIGEDLLAGIVEGLKTDHKMSVHEFGIFKLVRYAEREINDIQTGEKRVIPAHMALTFKPSKYLEYYVNPYWNLRGIPVSNAEADAHKDGVYGEEADESAGVSAAAVKEIETVIEETVDEIEAETIIVDARNDDDELIEIIEETTAIVVEETPEEKAPLPKREERKRGKDASSPVHHVAKRGGVYEEERRKIAGSESEEKQFSLVNFIPLAVIACIAVILAAALVFVNYPDFRMFFVYDQDGDYRTRNAEPVQNELSNVIQSLGTNDSVVEPEPITEEEMHERVQTAIEKTKDLIVSLTTGETVSYAIKNRDTLWDISRAHYDGNPWYWPLIYAENNKKIRNPDTLMTGTTIAIPRLREDVVKNGIENIPAYVKEELAKSYFEIYVLYARTRYHRTRDMLYMANMFDSDFVDRKIKENAITQRDVDYIIRIRRIEKGR